MRPSWSPRRYYVSTLKRMKYNKLYGHKFLCACNMEVTLTLVFFSNILRYDGFPFVCKVCGCSFSHIVWLLSIIFMQQSSCCINKSMMKHQQSPDLIWLNYGCQRCICVDALSECLNTSQLCWKLSLLTHNPWWAFDLRLSPINLFDFLKFPIKFISLMDYKILSTT